MVSVLFVLTVTALTVAYVDPFFHYHKPYTDKYYYVLDNQSSQNDGILKRFDYDSLITGSSMAANFKTSEAEELFGGKFIKVPYLGATNREIGENVDIALSEKPELKTVIRALDMSHFIEDKDAIRYDMGVYPVYLSDNNIFNDVEYVFNRDVIFKRTLPMIKASNSEGFKPGIDNFDEYSRWARENNPFGVNAIVPDGPWEMTVGEPIHMTEEEHELLAGNVTQNVIVQAEEHPDVDFYLFFSPYSAFWWEYLVESGYIYRHLESEREVIKMLLPYENIKLFSFNNVTEITTDMNNYTEAIHYGEWVNKLMLKYMHDGKGRLTKDNYEDYLSEIEELYLNFDYMTLFDQEDYEDDYLASEKLLGSYGD